MTKHFEEVFRGTAADALAHFATHAPRGEFTLLVGGARAPGRRTRDALGLVDTHAHLMDRAFDADRAAVLVERQRAGVSALMLVGYDLATSRAAVELARAIAARVGERRHPPELGRRGDRR